MLYLLDANVLMTAHNLYYPLDQVPEYWDWLIHMGCQNRIKVPFEIFEEFKDGPSNLEKDLLFAWIQEDANKKALLLAEDVELDIVQRVVSNGYAPDLTDDEIEQIGRDPFLIAYALVNNERCVVTAETSAPKKVRQNRRIPDVCKTLGARCCNPFELNRTLGFRTQWKVDIER
ncbi:MAG TPA: DUF4411 family protein [Burkholderiaceae bacterium]|nr:DUF4411 family protein [Burkholderiaceae bacterium]